MSRASERRRAEVRGPKSGAEGISRRREARRWRCVESDLWLRVSAIEFIIFHRVRFRGLRPTSALSSPAAHLHFYGLSKSERKSKNDGRSGEMSTRNLSNSINLCITIANNFDSRVLRHLHCCSLPSSDSLGHKLWQNHATSPINTFNRNNALDCVKHSLSSIFVLFLVFSALFASPFSIFSFDLFALRLAGRRSFRRADRNRSIERKS